MPLVPPTPAEFAQYRRDNPEAGVDQTFWALAKVTSDNTTGALFQAPDDSVWSVKVNNSGQLERTKL